MNGAFSRLRDAQTSPSGLFVTGTDTGVGKTYVARALVHALTARGLRVCVRKPVESGWMDPERSDAQALRRAAGAWEPLERVCPWRFVPAISPALAAQRSGVAYDVRDLFQACTNASADFLVVEGAGGFYSPLAPEGLNADLAVALQLPVLVVAADRLGAVNHTLLTLEALHARGLTLAALVFSVPEPAPEDLANLEELRRLTGLRSLVRVGHGEDAGPRLAGLLDPIAAAAPSRC